MQAVEKEPEVVLDPIPDVEWWDARILMDAVYPQGLADGSGTSASAADGTRGLLRGKVTALVEHPVPIEPPAEPEPPPPRPLMLTAKVRHCTLSMASRGAQNVDNAATVSISNPCSSRERCSHLHCQSLPYLGSFVDEKRLVSGLNLHLLRLGGCC